ncbi:MAG: hypothetical protein B7733_23665 [Myxococcales bacterium FL481]|nr:MAG: hypothetical protein B7733_23665 [Myxococcales bacterium FL481]
MTEIAQLLESALRDNRSALLRNAAIKTVSRTPLHTTIRELMRSDAAAAIRELTLDDLATALAGAAVSVPRAATSSLGAQASGADADSPRPKRRLLVTALPQVADESAKSREERLYRQILGALGTEPLTIGQLGKQLEIDTIELRGYLTWMKRMGKIGSVGRARATRYHALG